MGPSARFPLVILILSLAIVLASTGACQAGPESSELIVAAASSLAPVFGQMGDEFTVQTGIPEAFSFGSTGQLTQQIENGAPFDIFAAADELHVDRLISDGHLLPDSRLRFARGVLVVVVAADSGLESFQDAVQNGASRIVIANPAHAPYGAAAQQTLERSGLWLELQPRLVITETVRQATQTVETGNAEVGLVALSTALNTDLRIIDIDPQLYDPINHVAAISVDTPRTDQARAFLRFLTSEDGAELLRTYGLEPTNGS